MSSSNSASLRPAWHKGASGGRGFQPPPTVSERGDKSRSGSFGSQDRNSSNKFSVLDDEYVAAPSAAKADEKPASNPRSEAFRSSFGRGSSTGSKPTGRSLADLAAQVPESGQTSRRHSSFDARSGRFSHLRSSSDAGSGSASDLYKPDPSVIRYTREKLLSMRSVPKGNPPEFPEVLLELKGSVFLSLTPQDPVCWDTFDSEEIWGEYRERRISTGASKGDIPAESRLSASESTDQRRRVAPSQGRWARGVALPPPDEGGKRKSEHAENPNELWDDPMATGAASDFSAFGAIPPNDSASFDFEKMAEATKQLDEELHGSKLSDGDDIKPLAMRTVDTSRPLATAGMTITAGNGDDLNVFEDFDEPTAETVEDNDTSAVRSATEDPSASSRLMKMIGVQPPEDNDNNVLEKQTAGNPWGSGGKAAEGSEAQVPSIDPIFGSIGGLSLNPWGSTPGPAPVSPDGGIDLAGRLEALAAEQKAREMQIEMEKRAQQQAELLRRRQEEEAQRMALAQRQAEEHARHQQAAMQHQNSQQHQVELVLMERICSILENSWGQSDLLSILTTLHSEDSRVIPLLGNVDALRALIARSPQRVALRRDPNFAGDMAVLLMTNAQWKQQAQARAHQEEMRRLQMEEEARAHAQKQASFQINPDLPWFYSDPQNNIQGPFRGEEMRQWLEAGYFKGDLPISQQPSGPFHPLSVIFPDLSIAFKAPSGTGSVQEASERRAAEEEQLRKEKAEEERIAAEAAAKAAAQEAAEREKEEIERKAAEAKRAAATAEQTKASNGGNESSAQLKMMLGLSGGNGTAEAAPATSNKQTNDKKSSKGSKKGPKKALETPDAPPVVEKSPPAPKPVAPAWGAVANAKPKKSMSEIQQEEARAAALMAVQGGGTSRQSSSGWANVAAGTQGWSSGVVKKSQVAVPSVAANVVPAQARKSATSQASVGIPNPASLAHQQRVSSTASSLAEEFGATMSPPLEKWCKEQMQKINGSDDLTLVAFCMTLNDASEIRQYLTTYLGATSQVNNFATDFINKRGLGTKQEEWETLGGSKKGRKKKSGGR